MTDPTQDPEKRTEAQGEADLFREPGKTDQLTELEVSSIVSKLGALVLDEDTVLEEHQRDAFEDIVSFYNDGGRECYVQLPTGTGKTVLFVELSKKLLEVPKEDDEPQRIIVLTPTVDLVNQTVGGVDEESGKRRGYKGFAPDIDVRSITGSTPVNTRVRNITEADVLVTTYNTFRGLISGLVEGENIPEDEVQRRVAQLRQEAREHREKVGQLKSEQASLLAHTYHSQDVSQVRAGAAALLELGEKGKISSGRGGVVLERLCYLADEEALPPARKITEMKASVKTLAHKRVTMAASWMNTRRKQHRTDFVLHGNRDPEDYVPLTSQELESEAQDVFGLDTMECYLSMFLLSHRQVRTPKVFDLEPSSEKDKVVELGEQAVDEQSMHHHALGQIKALETQLQFNQAIAKYSLVICDEAHRAIGTQTWQALRDFAERKDAALIGLTATDQYLDRSVADYFEEKVHELTKQEAMRRKIVNPVVTFVHNTGLRYKGITTDINGDYDPITIREMRLDEGRNRLGVNYARIASEMGYHGLVTAIPGEGASHAKVLAAMINETTMIDPVTGEERLMRARYVIGDKDSDRRKEYYRQLEAKEIDWIVFVDVIREGWDSDTAKGIVNMRPSRAPVLVTQRTGRVGRTYPGAPFSLVIDLYDGMELEDGQTELPPVLVADIFGLDDIPQGTIIGGEGLVLGPEFDRLLEMMPGKITAHHSRYVNMFKNAKLIDARGAVKSSEGVSRNEWQTFDAIQRGFNGFLPKEVILDAIDEPSTEVRVMDGKIGGRIVPLFNVGDVMKLHQDAPEINPWKLYKDTAGTDWISPEGCTVMLSRRFPNIAAEDISDVLRMIEQEQGQKFDKQVARFRINFNGNVNARLGFTQLFKFSEVMERLVPYLKDLATLQS